MEKQIYVKWKSTDSYCRVIVIEGVFLQRKEWRDFFHYMVYLDCPRETRFLRESEETQKTFQNLKIGIGKQRIIT